MSIGRDKRLDFFHFDAKRLRVVFKFIEFNKRLKIGFGHSKPIFSTSVDNYIKICPSVSIGNLVVKPVLKAMLSIMMPTFNCFQFWPPMKAHSYAARNFDLLKIR